MTIGTTENPLRVAIIGAGPTGFYTADALLKNKEVVVEVDMFDRLPTPYGLVRDGVAPDHQKIKSVTKAYDRTAKKDEFRFFGYVELGKDVSVADLRNYYHQIIYTYGASSDRKLGIPGEDLIGSRTATEFVAWYNGHPDYRDYEFDLSQESVAVIGVGNVAIDVARILCRTHEALVETDIAEHALEALKNSKVKNVYVIGRRGPAQAAFTNTEVRELGELVATDALVVPEEAELDALSQQLLDEGNDHRTKKKVEIIQSFIPNTRTDKPKALTIRFLVSPVELIGDEKGQIKAMRLVKNELYQTDDGTLRPRATEQFETVSVGLVFRSVGYRGLPVEGVPFNDSWGIISNDEGRVVDYETKAVVTGEYAAGWIKRGPSGIIGTNKPDAVATVKLMLADFAAGQTLTPAHPTAPEAEAFIKQQQPQYFTYEDWLKLDEAELAKGKEQGRPRVKFTNIEDMLTAREAQK
ncbi:FAD-dependent oxidoreductase [Anaerolineales bacterium HSG6]|nr:FAD-dependent oxidoreductase [Anaerolineales bacterium HSG6]MDM8532900.1 FAD-dependent oxidoreductase [Anaerolineales bacterium HSG25]